MITLPKIPDIAKQVESNKSDILLKLDKGSFAGTASDLDVGKVGRRFFNGNIDDISETCIVSINSGVSGTMPSTGLVNGDMLQHIHWDMNAGYQIAYKYANADRQYVRSKAGNKWSAWKEVFHEGSSPISKQTNGYCKLANGMIIQWGVFQNCGVINGGTFNLPIAFSTTASATAMNITIASTNSVNIYFVTECRVSTTQITIKGMYSVNGEMRLVGMTDSYRWIAIGY